MSMFGELLGFDGKVTRIGYLARSVAMGAILTGAAALATWALATLLHPDGMVGALLGGRQIVMGALLVALWSSFALGVRRLRDMGLEPTYIVPFYAALWLADILVLGPMARLDPGRYAALESAWRVIAVIILLPLLLWPPRRGRKGPTLHEKAPPHTRYLDWRESG